MISYVATFAVTEIVGAFFPTVSAVLNGLNIGLTVGINLWKEISTKLGCSISDRAMKRDLYLNLLVYHSAITDAMTCTGGFGETLKNEKTIESLVLFEEGFSMYKKIRILCLKYGAEYAEIRRIAELDLMDKTESYFSITSTVMYAMALETSEFVCHDKETTDMVVMNCFDMVYVACPVDVYIYNGDTIVAQSVNDVVTVSDENAFATIELIKLSNEQENAAKVCIVPKGYELKIVGNDEGIMNVENISMENGTVATLSAFYEIPVETSAEYTIYEDKLTNITSDEKYEADVYMEYFVVSGDANNDGIVNVRDCAFIATALAKGTIDILSEAADFNNDSKVNVRDAAAIASALAKGEL